ncbi:MAG: putative membrane protein insertion efficiency factor [Candidatus Midichloriaceae bacterium]|jgi:putative membrane protein insertion efficiency factor
MKNKISSIFIFFSLLLLKIYQMFISPFMTSSCRYYPSCSEYAKSAIKTYGIKGLYYTFVRILKCNPFSNGGYDPIVKNKIKK